MRQLNSPLSLRKCALRLPGLPGGTATGQDEFNRRRDFYESAPSACLKSIVPSIVHLLCAVADLIRMRRQQTCQVFLLQSLQGFL
jgi:hypothetical protein